MDGEECGSNPVKMTAMTTRTTSVGDHIQVHGHNSSATGSSTIVPATASAISVNQEIQNNDSQIKEER